jgi:hypothetical protein
MTTPSQARINRGDEMRARKAERIAKPPCPRCANTGSPDYAGFALERCGCGDAS